MSILILTSDCFQLASANGICALALRDSFAQKGINTFVIGTSKEDNFPRQDGTFGFVRAPHNSSKNMFSNGYLNSLKRVFSPDINKSVVDQYVSIASEIIRKNDVQIVVAVYYPIETLDAIRILKKKYPHIITISYELDSATDGIHSGGKGDKLFDLAYIRWMNKLYETIDYIFIMESHREHFETLYARWKKKTEIVDLPVLKDNTKPHANRNNTPINFFYTGILDRRYRSPKVLLETFSVLLEKHDWNIHFYSRGNCEETIKEYAVNHPGIMQHGFVSPEVLDAELSDADFLLNIGNTNSNSLPSKLITYFSTGKPIIHFSSQENDVCIKYLDKYPLALVIKQNDSNGQIAERIESFVAKSINERINYSEIEKYFLKNTPSYSAKKIMEIASSFFG